VIGISVFADPRLPPADKVFERWGRELLYIYMRLSLLPVRDNNSNMPPCIFAKISALAHNSSQSLQRNHQNIICLSLTSNSLYMEQVGVKHIFVTGG